MSQPQHSDTKSSPSPKSGSQKGRLDAQRQRDAHTNSATSGDESGDAQHSSTKNLETEPDRVGK